MSFERPLRQRPAGVSPLGTSLSKTFLFEKLNRGFPVVSQFEIVRGGSCLKRAGLSGWQLLSYISHFVDNLAPVERVLSGGRGIG